MTPDQLAQAVAEAMWAQDRASQALGMRLEHVAAETARLSMSIRADMLNGFALAHGGLIGTLADSAFAFACNSGNQLTVASGYSIDIVMGAREGDVLTATGRRVAATGRTGLYDVQVRNQRDELVAEFRGRATRLKDRRVVPDLPLAGEL
ncbi:hydroxyphenylacetyl-CoA thioesterase PaaI [Inhella gelatinilytica]|uniref:Hydroxyphenylacetyl-CoA thioesterase PaaI n=1 Tax=Inhella gelatinilytica TaxID=2795030 RepID=A0A931NA09_9BURK|nr:hydroxyphenylacetyl-CoA thioesterase PaaI [Inhella gelatinilytica]MBH9551958.1 hydroxyphenylacetyl-CoA thioesterase PaaI [Inhella gelatinilytica]